MKFGPGGIRGFEGTNSFNGEKQIKSVRVKDIILNENHPKFNEYNGWAGIGTIFFDEIESGGLSSLGKKIQYAHPYFSNIKFYPLIGEIVSVIFGPNPELIGRDGKDREELILYYLPPSNVWGSIHHNATRDPNASSLTSEGKNYEEVNSGLVNREQEKSNLILLGDTFQERSNILPLYFYEGDHILEGRWGNTIRLGSTVKDTSSPNEWSSVNKEGDPIIIISNNTIDNRSGFSPRVEEINRDLSTIYLTSTQKLPFTPSSFQTDSFGPKDQPPPHPQEYQKNQIILNSGRLILNSRTDGVLISSPTIIHLSAGESIHFDSNNKIVLSSGELYLISRNATEQAVLGNQLVSLLKTLIQTIRNIQTAFAGASNAGGGIPSLNTTSGNLSTAANDMERQLKNILSTKIKLQ